MTLQARRPTFDWEHTPLHWIPDEPYATHANNTLHLLAPVFERGLIALYKEVLPRLKDERLRQELRGFLAQEATHARAHDQVLAWMREHGLETAPFIAACERDWQAFAGDTPPLGVPAEAWLRWRLALAAAGEHLTCVVGHWSVSTDALDRAGADPEMLAMLRWHGAEEVEHRAVTFDVLRAVAGPTAYPLRVAAMVATLPFLAGLWNRAVAYMLANDPLLRGRTFGRRDYQALLERGLAPGRAILEAVARYMHPAFHPDQEGSLELAQGVLAGMTRRPAL
ncbi:MAG: hypothetical protein JWM80_969 [Cyanobacteria bacterium RYN_339]|nr:hypothetical protein [Cyanobacteria bacterium RYN_339]